MYCKNDFAARADWCVMSPEEANHAPEVSVDGSLDISAKAGETVQLNGEAIDPDGDALSYKWWQYQEAGTYDNVVSIEKANTSDAEITIPEDVQPGQTIHLILEVTDNGSPELKKFARVIVTIA